MVASPKNYQHQHLLPTLSIVSIAHIIMNADQDLTSKLPKLTGAKDFIPWNHQMKVYVQRNDMELLGRTNLVDDAATAQRTRWNKDMVRAKKSIFLALGIGPMAQTSHFIDNEDASAKD